MMADRVKQKPAKVSPPSSEKVNKNTKDLITKDPITKDILTKDIPAVKDMSIDNDLSKLDMMTILYSEIMRKKITGHHIASMNLFYSQGIKQIVTKLFPCEKPFIKNERDKTPEDLLISSIGFKVDFMDINLTPPTTTKYKSGTTQMLIPNKCREKNLTYSAPMYIDAVITATATYKDGSKKVRKDDIKNHRIGSIPVMIGTELDNTHNCSRETLKQLKEDPEDIGGYFLIRGMEWVIDNLESTANNTFNAFKNMHGNEIARGTFLSKPGDHFENSYQIILRLMNTGAITIELPARGNKDVVIIPFYLIFKAFGMTRDREIITNISYGFNDDAISRDILQILNRAFTVENKDYAPVKNSNNPNEILLYIAKKIEEFDDMSIIDRDDNIQKHLIANTLSMLDRFILPHIGNTASVRIQKLKFLGHLINRLICVSMDIIDSTDRDSYAGKRLFSAGTSLSKSFKTHFNFVVSAEIIKNLTRDFKSTSFSLVKLAETVKSSIKVDDLEKSLMQAITSGNKTINIKRTDVVNRVSSELLHRKNDMNTKSVANQVNTPDTTASKQNERADEMRRVHPTYLGYIDVSQSADTGEKVGMSKQLACSASICNSSSSWILKDILLKDDDIIDEKDVFPEDIYNEKLVKVFINGAWVGCCRSAHGLVYKYRQKRRNGDIHHLTSIIWMPGVREVYFWTDVGRVHRPLLIVYNNIQEYIDARANGKPIEFRQWITLKKSHIIGLQTKKLVIDDLRNEGVLEYISAGEQENCYLAMNIDWLRSHHGDVTNRFTHCDIDQAIFGIVTLAAPLANHSNATRVTYYTNHRKQSIGWFVLNYPHRIDKGTTFQHYCERPIVSTFSDALTFPNGHNAIVALIIHGGQNQEDSIKANQSSIDCGMFNASHYNYKSTELDKGEQFGNPDPLRTTGKQKNGIFEFIEGGKFVKVGTTLKQNYAMAIKVVKINKPVDDKYIYADKSMLYTKDEPAYVERVKFTRNDEDVPIVKIKYRSERSLGIGDKMASRSGNKGIVSATDGRQNMVYLESGIIPDLYVNPHSIPTRSAINQLIECLLGQLCIKKGVFINATSFMDVDLDSIIKELESYGVMNKGNHRVYNPVTGEPIDNMIFVGVTTYQRLAKFVVDEKYAIMSGPTNAVTRQPVDGKLNNGGIRLGEMEKDCLVAHGCMDFMAEKWYVDSDGYDRYICRGCGQKAIVNLKYGIYKCKYCEDNADIVTQPSTWTANQLDIIVNAMNAKTTYEIEPFTYSRKDE